MFCSFQIIFVFKFLATGEYLALELERSELQAGMLEKSEGDGFLPGNYYLEGSFQPVNHFWLGCARRQSFYSDAFLAGAMFFSS